MRRVVLLRAATEADRDFFRRVRREAFERAVAEWWGWDEAEQDRRSDAAFDRDPVQIVEAEAGPIGYLSVVHEEDHDFVAEVALLPSAQRAGIGTKLLRDAMEAARRRGVPLGLSVYVDNPAQRLYERLGFRVLRVEHPRIFMEWTG